MKFFTDFQKLRWKFHQDNRWVQFAAEILVGGVVEVVLVDPIANQRRVSFYYVVEHVNDYLCPKHNDGS